MLTDAQKNIIKKLVRAHGNLDGSIIAGNIARKVRQPESGEDTCLVDAPAHEVETYATNLRLTRDPVREADRKRQYNGTKETPSFHLPNQPIANGGLVEAA